MIIPLFILMSLSTLTNAKRTSCLACINSVCFSRATILKGYKFSGQLAIDRESNILYFHYQNNRSTDFTGSFDLTKVKFTNIPNLSFTFGHAVNQATRELYTSATQGIYKYDPIKNETELFGLTDKTIWHMQFKNNLYYTEFKKKGLYTYINKKSKSIPELSNYQIDDFVIDKRNDTYFMSNYSLHVLKHGAKQAKLFEDEIYLLSVDKDGYVHFIQPYTKGIYKIHHRTKKLTEIGAFKVSTFKLVFDKYNNIIYYDSTNKKLFYLSPTLNKCTVTTKGRHRKKFIATSFKAYTNHKKTNISEVKNITEIK